MADGAPQPVSVGPGRHPAGGPGREHRDDDEFVVAFLPRSRDVLDFIRRVKDGPPRAQPRSGPVQRRPPVPPARYPPVIVRDRFAMPPPLEALAVVEGRAGLPQRGRHPQHRLQLVADERRRHQPRRPASSRASTPIAASTRSRCSAAAGGPAARGPEPGGDRRRDLLLVHQHAAAAVRRHLAVRPARHVPDPRLVRPRGGLRGLPLRPGRGDAHDAGRPHARCWWSSPRSSRTRSAACAPRA